MFLQVLLSLNCSNMFLERNIQIYVNDTKFKLKRNCLKKSITHFYGVSSNEPLTAVSDSIPGPSASIT